MGSRSIYAEQSQKAVVGGGPLSRDLKELRARVRWAAAGRADQAEGTAGVNNPGQDHPSGVQRTARRLSLEQSKEENWGQGVASVYGRPQEGLQLWCGRPEGLGQSSDRIWLLLSLFNNFLLFIYLLLVALGLRCSEGFSLVGSEQRLRSSFSAQASHCYRAQAQ